MAIAPVLSLNGEVPALDGRRGADVATELRTLGDNYRILHPDSPRSRHPLLIEATPDQRVADRLEWIEKVPEDRDLALLVYRSTAKKDLAADTSIADRFYETRSQAKLWRRLLAEDSHLCPAADDAVAHLIDRLAREPAQSNLSDVTAAVAGCRCAGLDVQWLQKVLRTYLALLNREYLRAPFSLEQLRAFAKHGEGEGTFGEFVRTLSQ